MQFAILLVFLGLWCPDANTTRVHVEVRPAPDAVGRRSDGEQAQLPNTGQIRRNDIRDERVSVSRINRR